MNISIVTGQGWKPRAANDKVSVHLIFTLVSGFLYLSSSESDTNLAKLEASECTLHASKIKVNQIDRPRM